MLFAKNSDRPISEIQIVEHLAPRPAGGTTHSTYLPLPDAGARGILGSRPIWMWGLEHGVNTERVAIGNEQVWTIDDPREAQPALTGMDIVRLALERATSAEEAVTVITDLIETHGQGGVGNQVSNEAYWSSFLAADPTDAWIVETSEKTWAARQVPEGWAISNRLSLTTGWDRASADVEIGQDFQRWQHPTMATGHADVRLAETLGGVTGTDTSGPIATPRDMAALLRSHRGPRWGLGGEINGDHVVAPPEPGSDPAAGDGVSVCLHLRDYQATTASMMVDLPTDPRRPVRAWVTVANPCASIYVPVFPPDGLPAILSSPTTAVRFAGLARSVEDPERGVDRLRAIRAILDPVEARLWTQADEVAGDSLERVAWARSIDQTIDDALSEAERTTWSL